MCNPPSDGVSEYAPLSYWGWTDEVSGGEIARQIQELRNKEFCGYVMNARSGLKMAFRSPEWAAGIQAMLLSGAETGMKTFLNDDFRWPSGASGAVRTDLQVQWLVCDILKSGVDFRKNDRTLGLYDVLVARREHPVCSEPVSAHIYYETDGHNIDIFNPEAVGMFIETTVEYHRRLAGNSWKNVFSIFTDEPRMSRGNIVWSPFLERDFYSAYGYEIRPRLPALFFPVEGCETVRYHYMRLVAETFAGNFSRRMKNWCGENGVKFSGHLLDEEDFSEQILSSGAVMPFYRHMDIPGIDWLHRRSVNNVTLKQVVSVAHQFGKRRILSEMFGCAGWSVSFQEMKWIADWHFLSGVNMILQHMAVFSLKGDGKREFPPSIFYQQPWWQEMPGFNRYLEEKSRLIAESRPVIDILILHPMSGAWAEYQGTRFGQEDSLYIKFKQLTDLFMSKRLDFHYGDEILIEESGEVSGDLFRIGNREYSVVIIPETGYIAGTTSLLLDEYVRNGGRLYILQSPPAVISSSGEICRSRYLDNLQPTDAESLSEFLQVRDSAVKIESIDGNSCPGVYASAWENQEGRFFQILNTGDYQEEICIHPAGYSGEKMLVLEGLHPTAEPFSPRHSYILKPRQSLLITGPAVAEKYFHPEHRSVPAALQSCRTLDFSRGWEIAEYSDNCLVLDHCRFRIPDGKLRDDLPFRFIRERIPVTALNGLLEKYAEDLTAELEFEFFLNPSVESVSRMNLQIVLENPEETLVYLNDIPIDTGGQERWWLDKSFRILPCSSEAIRGRNILRLKKYCRYSRKSRDSFLHSGIENVFILGNFAVEYDRLIVDADRGIFVDGRFMITRIPDRVRISELYKSGFPFFAGRLALKRDFLWNDDPLSRTFLAFHNLQGLCLNISVNGEKAGTLMCEPSLLEITAFLSSGNNLLEVEILTSCRNALGPHHHINGDPGGVGHSSFKGYKSWTDAECPMAQEETRFFTWNEGYSIVNPGPGECQLLVACRDDSVIELLGTGVPVPRPGREA